MFSHYNLTAKCTSARFSTQQAQHLLTVIQASALPGLSPVIALRETVLNCLVEV